MKKDGGNMAERKCPHCGSSLNKPIMEEKEWITWQCPQCGGYSYVPRKKEPGVWD